MVMTPQFHGRSVQVGFAAGRFRQRAGLASFSVVLMFVALSATFWNIRLASAEDAAAASAASATTTTTTPKTLWAQREHILYLRINTPDVDVASITTFVNDTHVQLTLKHVKHVCKTQSIDKIVWLQMTLKSKKNGIRYRTM